MRATGLVSLAAATALCVAACGGADTAAVVRLGPDDNGKTVTLAVGDRLQVILSGGRLTGDWALTSYPRPALVPDPGAMPVGGVALVAREVGSGQVVLVRVLCGPPVDPPSCPGAAASDPGRHHRHAGPSRSPSADGEPRSFTSTLRMASYVRS